MASWLPLRAISSASAKPFWPKTQVALDNRIIVVAPIILELVVLPVRVDLIPGQAAGSMRYEHVLGNLLTDFLVAIIEREPQPVFRVNLAALYGW